MNTLHDTHFRRVALIKRPPLVRSSSPATCYQSNRSAKQKKSVRFCDSLENVRLFLKTDKPKACQSDPTSPKKYTYQLRLPNWPSNPTVNVIRIEKIELICNQLVGTCQVANLAFEKHVVIRYTQDDWVTVKQVDAIYKEPIANSVNTWDRFSFKIVLNRMHHAHETLCLAAKYTVAGREFWDNNNLKDYSVEIIPKVQLQYDDSCSSSDEDDDNTFDDCCTDEEDQHELSLLVDKSSFGNRYDFNSAVNKPWSPPLSPTTPVDMNPLWSIHNDIKPVNWIHNPVPSL